MDEGKFKGESGKLKKLEKITRTLSTKDKKRKKLLLNDLLLKPANV